MADISMNVELFPYDDFSLMDDEEAFRELCSTLNFDVFDDSITSEDILRRKRDLDVQTGDIYRTSNQFYSSGIVSSNNPPIYLYPENPKPPTDPAMISISTTSSYPCVPPTFPFTSNLPLYPAHQQDQLNSDSMSVSTDQHSVASSKSSSCSRPVSSLPVHDGIPFKHQPQHQQHTASFMGLKSSSGTDASAQQHQATNKARKIAKSLISLDDIRRQYAHIFAEAFNGMDRHELLELLYRYATPSCLAVYKYVGNPNPIYGPSYCELHGVEAIANYWHAIFCAVPDSVFEVQENKLRVLAASSSIGGGNGLAQGEVAPVAPCAIVMKFIFSGTKIFKISADNHSSVIYSDHDALSPQFQGSNEDADDVIGGQPSESAATPTDWLSSVLGEDLSSENNSADEDASGVGSMAGQKATRRLLHNQLGLDGCLEKSVPMTLLGTMTFFAGSDKKIYKIEVVYCVRA